MNQYIYVPMITYWDIKCDGCDNTIFLSNALKSCDETDILNELSKPMGCGETFKHQNGYVYLRAPCEAKELTPEKIYKKINKCANKDEIKEKINVSIRIAERFKMSSKLNEN
jgi:exosome complex RNA-binding protein Rrp4